MPVSETRLAVRLTDNATAGLQSLNSAYGRFANTVQNSGAKVAQFNRQMTTNNFGGFATSADKAAGSLKNMNQMLERLIYSASRYFVIYKALGAVGNIWDSVVGGSYEYAKSLETNQIGIAGILKSMITLNGESVKWNDAMAISGKAMKSLQSEALRTAATSKELIETFRALLGPGLSSGMSIDQIVQLSTVGTNAVRSLGLPTNQYVQELRSIITEGIRPASSTLATSLGITNKDIKEAKASSEGLFNFLMKRMQGFSDAVKYTSDTVEGRLARIEEGLRVAGSKGAESLYKSFSATLEKIANYLIPVPKKLGEQWQINPEFVKGVEEVSTRIAKIAKDITEIGVSAAPLASVFGGGALTAIGQFADKLQYIVGFMLAKKLSPFVADIAQLTIQSRNAYEAQTGLGQVLQGVSDKISGRSAAIRSMMGQEQKAAEVSRLYNAELTKVNAAIAQQRALDREAKGQGMVSWVRNPKTEVWRAENLAGLMTKLREIGAEEERVQALAQRYFSYLKTGSHEAADKLGELIIAEEREYQAKKKQIEADQQWGASVRTSAERAGTLMSTIGGLSMSFGFLCDVLGQADEGNKEWYTSAADAAMTAGMFATAVGGITSAIAGMIPAIRDGIKALRAFAATRTLAGIGIAGAAVAGIGAAVAYKYNEFKKTGVASQLDEYGNEVSYNFNNTQGVDDADSYAILNNPSYDYGSTGLENIAVKDYGGGSAGGGGSKGRGGGGGASKANKAEESAARMKKIIEDLNKEMTNMDGKATAYEKAMASAKDKIAGYEKDIVKAQQLGVDIGEVRKAQADYMLAAERKAVEAQQDENLKYMKLDEDAANRIFTMGGTMEQQREVLGQRLEAHKAYLEELIAAETENKKRRASLEAQLAETVKQIHANTAYNMKQGWLLGLEEIANQQTNFKDVTTSIFGDIENGLVTLVNGAGTAKEKFKNFCQDITNTILKSMTQIIIKGLITKAVMAAIGLGGGSVSVGNVGNSWANSFTGGSVSNYVPSGYGAGVGISANAKGGNVRAGEWSWVGEQGPELVRFGRAGHVYSNGQSKNIANSAQNVKIELINESGTELKADNASVKFDLDTMIISAVIKGVNNNTMGVRTMFKGMAST